MLFALTLRLLIVVMLICLGLLESVTQQTTKMRQLQEELQTLRVRNVRYSNTFMNYLALITSDTDLDQWGANHTVCC